MGGLAVLQWYATVGIVWRVAGRCLVQLAQELAKAPGSETAVRLVEADGYRSVQGMSRGADGKWRGKALRGTTLVDVSVDPRGTVTSP